MADDVQIGPVAAMVGWLLGIPFAVASIFLGLRIFEEHGLVWAVVWFGVGEWPVALVVVGLPVTIVGTIESHFRKPKERKPKPRYCPKCDRETPAQAICPGCGGFVV